MCSLNILLQALEFDKKYENEKIFRSNEKLSCSNEILSRSNEILSRSNEKLSRSNEKSISFEREKYLVLTRN